MGGLHFLRISGVGRYYAILETFWEGLGESFGRVLGVNNGKTVVQEGSEKKAEKEDEKIPKLRPRGGSWRQSGGPRGEKI